MKNSFKDLAIVISVKNGEETLEACLNSISIPVSQGAILYIFDAFSTDGTKKMIQRKYPDAIYFCKKDKGLYYAWNNAIETVSEPFLFFINCDDTLYSSTNLLKLVKILRMDGQVVASSGQTLMTRQDGVDRCAGQKIIRDWFIGDMPIVTPATVYVVKALKSIKGFDTCYNISSDYDMILRLLKKYGPTKFVFSKLVLVRFSLGGMSNKNHSRAFSEIRMIILKRLGLMKYILHILWYITLILKRRLLAMYFKL